MTIPPPYQHQKESADFWIKHKCINNFSDAGTGKTRSAIDGFQHCPNAKRMLAITPLSIMRPSWGEDIETFAPTLNYRIAHGNTQKRKDAFLDTTADIVITNHDAAKWLMENRKYLEGFSHLVIDESTAYKNPTAQRTVNIFGIMDLFEYRCPMSAAPHPKNILDLWSQCFISDWGDRLGSQFYRFQNEICTSEEKILYGPDGLPIIKKGKVRTRKVWTPREDAEETCAALIADNTLRYRLEDCIDMPECVVSNYKIDMPGWLQIAYDDFLEHRVLELEDAVIDAVHAAALRTKLRQMLGGALYDNGEVVRVHKERSELIMELASQAPHSIIGFNFRHEREMLCDLAKKFGMTYSYIDGSVPQTARYDIWQAFQDGQTDVIFLHPQSAGHGLTFTRATRTIWHSPPENYEHYKQLNHRMYRAGQKSITNLIRVSYRDTIEDTIYGENLDFKAENQQKSLDVFEAATKLRRTR